MLKYYINILYNIFYLKKFFHILLDIFLHGIQSAQLFFIFHSLQDYFFIYSWVFISIYK